MKRLDQYETPETDSKAIQLHGTRLAPGCLYVKADDMREVERRLAACREQLRSIMESSSSTRIRRECKETLTLTKP